MASLEELLSKEGFKRGKSKQSSYGSPASKDSRLPPYSTRNRVNSVDQRARRDRSKSDAFSRRSWPLEGGRSQGQDLRRSILQRKSSADVYKRESPKIRGFDIESYSEEESNERYQVQYPDSIEESDEDDLPKEQGILYTEKFQPNDNEFPEDEKLERNTDTVKDTQVSDLKLDEIGVKAIISVLTGYLRRFFKDENFRASLYQSCASCLGINESYENDQSEDGVIDNLNQAIRVVEGTAVGSPSSQELKRAALQLSVITGLSSMELKDGFSSGIPNLQLAACAHIYLSIIYKFQKKDKVSAKHLLHVFCDSPNQARTKLLPVLWDRLIFAHLSHLREWYDSEAEMISRSPSRLKKMKLLEEMYSNILDVGTYRFGVYYKEWLDDEAEDPELPSIVAPQASFMWTPREISGSFDSDEFSSPGSSASSQAKVSKKLYESVFRQSKKKFEEVDQMGVWKDKENEEVAVVVEEIEDVKNNKPMFGSERQGDKITGAYYLNMGGENFQEDYRDSPADDIQSYDTMHADKWRTSGCKGSSKLNLMVKEKVESENLQSSASKMLQVQTENELTLKRLAEGAFQPQVDDHHKNPQEPELNDMNDTKFLKSEMRKTRTVSRNSDMNLSLLSPGTSTFGGFEDIDKDSFFSRIPKDFVCPITGQLFQDPVTLESGQTYERVAIKEWFDQGNKTCPVTKRTLEFAGLPVTNFVLKRVIDGWRSENCRNLLFLATQIAGNITTQEAKSKDESALFIIEQLLTRFSVEEQTENARYLISLGGLQFLIRRLELGNLEEKIRISALLLCCIKANGFCRNYLAKNIGTSSVLELLHCKQFSARSNAVALLIELICLNRRTAINSFISGLRTKDILNTMQVLLLYLQGVRPEERVIIAVLLLHFDLMVEPRQHGVYREEAVDSIILALDLCLSDTKFIPNCRKALLMLGGYFSFSGETLTETWLLKQAGFCDDSGTTSISYDEGVDEMIPEEENEEKSREKEEWLKNVALVLLCSGKGLFLETLSKCLDSQNTELLKVCLTTIAWMSHALASLSLSDLQLSVFLSLIPRMKEILEKSEQIEHRILASLSMLNFSKISECRILLMSFAEEIHNPLKHLVEMTSIAKHLYATVFGILDNTRT